MAAARLLALLVVALLAAPAATAMETAPDAVPLPASDDLPPALSIHPDTLRATFDAQGPLAAYWMLASASFQQDEAPPSEDDSFVQHFFMGLGDADGDHRGDVVVTRIVLEDGEVEELTLTALSAGRPDKVLWTLEVDTEEEAVFLAGDLDGDHVLDLFRIDDTRSDGNRFRMEVTGISGVDLSELTAFELEGGYTHERSGLPILVGEEKDHVTFELPFPMDLFRAPGYEVLTIHIELRHEREGVVIATEQRQEITYGTTIERRTLEGTPVWTAGSDKKVWSAMTDGDDDGVHDLVFAEGIGTWSTSSRMLGLPPLEEREEERRPVTLELVSGATGATVWSQRTEVSNDDVFVTTLGNLFGQGPTVALVELSFEIRQTMLSADYDIATRLAFFSARDGAPATDHHWDGQVVLPHDLGDADGDGRDDLLLMVFDLLRPREQYQAVRGDLTSIWSLVPEGRARIADFTGDGVYDLLDREEDELELYDGTTGKALWELDIKDMASATPMHDIDLDGGNDILVLEMEDLGDVPSAGTIQILNGADATLVWKKQVYDAADHPDVKADHAFANAARIGDLNRDRASEVALYLVGSIDCDDCDGMPTIMASMLLDGARGDTVLRYDATPLTTGSFTEHAAQLGPAGYLMESRLDRGSPGIGILALAALAGLVVLARRRTR